MLAFRREFLRPTTEVRQRSVTRPVPKLAVSSSRQAQGRIEEAREAVRRWRFHLKCRRNRFPIPYSLFAAVAGLPEALAAPQLDAEDSVLVANAEQRKVFSERPFKLDDLVL